jgi:hypothetical protein
MIDSALVNILKDENYDYDVTKICLDVLYTLVTHKNHHMEKKKSFAEDLLHSGFVKL